MIAESLDGFGFLRRQGIGFAEVLIMLDTMLNAVYCSPPGLYFPDATSGKSHLVEIMPQVLSLRPSSPFS